MKNLQSKIQEAVDSLKADEWDLLPPGDQWIRWREGRIPAGANVLGAMLRHALNVPGKGFMIPEPSSWKKIICEKYEISDFHFQFFNSTYQNGKISELAQAALDRLDSPEKNELSDILTIALHFNSIKRK